MIVTDESHPRLYRALLDIVALEQPGRVITTIEARSYTAAGFVPHTFGVVRFTDGRNTGFTINDALATVTANDIELTRPWSDGDDRWAEVRAEHTDDGDRDAQQTRDLELLLLTVADTLEKRSRPQRDAVLVAALRAHAQELHRQLDPHCTCNDCIDHARGDR